MVLPGLPEVKEGRPVIDDEIIQEALADGRFEPNVWLTFYLFGDPASLKAMKPELI